MNKFASGAIVAVVAGLSYAAARHGVEWLRRDDGSVIGLAGSVRSEFTTSARASCLKSQRDNKDNAGIPDGILQSYCRCYSNELADRVSINELRRLPQDDKAAMAKALEKQIASAAEPCLEEVAKTYESVSRPTQK